MMSSVGIHCCYWWGTDAESTENALVATKKTGADVFEIDTWVLLQKSIEELKNIRKIGDDLGLLFSCNGGFNNTNDIASDDPGIRRNGIEMAKKVLERFEILGACIWSGINYSAWLRMPEKLLTKSEKKRVWDLSVQSLREIVKTAEDYNVTYCLEVVNRYEQFLLNTAAEGVAMAEEIGSKNVKLLLDSFHMNIEEDNMADAITYAAKHDRLGHIHVGESNRRVIGAKKSNIDWKSFFDALKRVNYDGIIVLEPFLIMGIPLSMDIKIWRDLSEDSKLEQMIEKAKSGVEFVKAHIGE